jgi:hypothetical protein
MNWCDYCAPLKMAKAIFRWGNFPIEQLSKESCVAANALSFLCIWFVIQAAKQHLRQILGTV